MSIQAPAAPRPAVATGVATAAKAGHYRWYVCGLLFFASVINYIDRQVIGILKPTLQQQYGWSELDYGDIVFSFQLAYAIGFLFAGRLMDRLGTRLGFCDCDRRVERCCDGACVGHVLRRRRRRDPRDVRADVQRVGRRLHGCAICAGSRRGRQLPRRDQDGRRMVPAQGARIRDRHLQCRHEHRCAPDAADRSRSSRFRTDGSGRSSRRARSGFSGSSCGGSRIARRRSTRASARQSSRTSAAIRLSPRRRCRGERFFRIARRGRSLSRSS